MSGENPRPCQGVCGFSGGKCTGCKMTVSEIRSWWDMTNEEQTALAAELEDR